MTLLELRNQIDFAIAKFGGDTEVETRNVAGDWEFAEQFAYLPPKGKLSGRARIGEAMIFPGMSVFCPKDHEFK